MSRQVGFADSFWSGDYAGGLGVLFSKLQQGVIENQQVLNIARLRAEAEDLYGTKLEGIPGQSDRAGGFGRDDGASVKKAFEGLRKEMEEAGKHHRKVGNNIRKLVIEPFSRWCEGHEARVTDSHDELQARIKAYDKQLEQIKKLRSAYFNKCRVLEDIEEENQLAFRTPEPTAAATAAAAAEKVSSPTTSEGPPVPAKTPTLNLPVPEDPEDDEPLEIGDNYVPPSEVRKLLAGFLETVPLGEHKVAILGTYQNVTTGDEIVRYIQEKMGATTISLAERIGQDLVNNNFLRLIGNVGNTFANSSKMHYQWKDKAFEWAGIQKKKEVKRTPTFSLGGGEGDSPSVTAIGDIVGSWMSNPHPNETPGEKLRREAREADEKYKAGVKALDLTRCQLEEAMMNHLRFMEQCELDRLKAIKAVMLDFSSAISNVIPAIQASVDKLMLYQETIQPLGDLRYLLESYRTGSFVPKVVTYESYYNSADDQTFGVDLEARARADRKRMPLILMDILAYLDSHYPDMEDDESRRNIWLANVPLEASHHLRNKINNGKGAPQEILAEYDLPIIASVFKLYLLELPDSLVSSTKYEIFKTIYTNHGTEEDDRARLSVIQSTLGGMPLTNIATLDAVISHLTTIVELTSAPEEYITKLAHAFANCILRPRFETSLTHQERHSYRLIRDLFAHKEFIFSELKRASTVTTTRGRDRAISTDESQRRHHAEARSRAIIENARSRPTSPAPGVRHRRESSTHATGRFPIVPTSPQSRAPTRTYRPSSLEVPDAANLSLRNQQQIEPTHLASQTLPPQPHSQTPPPPSPPLASPEDFHAPSPPPPHPDSPHYSSGFASRQNSLSQRDYSPTSTSAGAAGGSPGVGVAKSNSLSRSGVTASRFPRRPQSLAKVAHGGPGRRDSAVRGERGEVRMSHSALPGSEEGRYSLTDGAMGEDY